MTKTYKAVLQTQRESKEEEKKMKFLQKAVLGALVMLLVGSGVAQAQKCIVRSVSPLMARAEGITETVGTIELECTHDPTGFAVTNSLKVSVKLSTNITNEIDGDRDLVAGNGISLMMSRPGVPDTEIGMDEMIFGTGKLGNDGRTLEWTVDTQEEIDLLELGMANQVGFNLMIAGIRANAYTVGNGEDIMATVMVGGVSAGASFNVANVKTGLTVKVTDAQKGTICAAESDGAEAMVIIQEHKDFPTAFNMAQGAYQIVLSFDGIPEGVTVSLPPTISQGDAAKTVAAKLQAGRRTDVKTDGELEPENGSADAVYFIVDAPRVPADSDEDASTTMSSIQDTQESLAVPVTFKWGTGDDAPKFGTGSVSVTFHPVSDNMEETFSDSLERRFAPSGDSLDVVTITDCATTLLFPFVTNMADFDTGLAITNFSSKAGSCDITYYGPDGAEVASRNTGEIAGPGNMTLLLSEEVAGFQGLLKAVCEFVKGQGFAFVTNGYGSPAGPTLAQGYLAIKE